MRGCLLLLGLAACGDPDTGDAVAPRVASCTGGGGRVEATGTLAVAVDGEPLRPWRAEVLVLPDEGRATVETFACVLDDTAQVATWSVVFHLPGRVDDPLELPAGTGPGVDGVAGEVTVLRDGLDVEVPLDAVSARVDRYDRDVGVLRGSVTAEALEATFDLRW